MSNPYRDKLLGLGVIGRRDRPRVREGRKHAETGRPWKSTATEAGTVTEHAVPGDRVDAVARVETVRLIRSGSAVRNA